MTTTLDALGGLLLQWGPHHPTGPHWGGPMGPHWSGGTMPWGASAAGGGSAFALVWALVWLLLLAAVMVVGAVLLRRAMQGKRAGEDDEALATLRRRYARGEVDDEEYRNRRGMLGGNT